jgi:hypothetical protein
MIRQLGNSVTEIIFNFVLIQGVGQGSNRLAEIFLLAVSVYSRFTVSYRQVAVQLPLRGNV